MIPRRPASSYPSPPRASLLPSIATARVDTPIEVEYYRNGGILHTALRQTMRES